MKSNYLGISASLFWTSAVFGFAPSVLTPSLRIDRSLSLFLATSNADEDTTTMDSFDTYQLGQSTLVYRDEDIGEGESAKEGDVLKVSFVGTLYPSGQQFSKNDDFVFELGAGKTMPGFDVGLGGTKVGSKRRIRVPPLLAFGDRGNPVSCPTIV